MLVTMSCLEHRVPWYAFYSPAFENSLIDLFLMRYHQKENACFRPSAPLPTYADNSVASAIWTALKRTVIVLTRKSGGISSNKHIYENKPNNFNSPFPVSSSALIYIHCFKQNNEMIFFYWKTHAQYLV